MEGKDAILGILLIAVVGLAGGIGYLAITPPECEECEDEDCPECPTCEEPITYQSGLPDDWSAAPNASSLILYNETGVAVEITLGQILDYIVKYQETSQEKYWYEKRLQPVDIYDPLGIPLTGVPLLQLLTAFDCYYAAELEFTSHNDTASTLTIDVAKLAEIYDELLVVIAANKQWLPQSIVKERYGNFSLVGMDLSLAEDGEVEFTAYNLKDITVSKNWTIDVNVYNADYSLNQTLELDFLNMTTNPSNPQTYEYINNAWYNYNRTYIGRNISTIVGYTKAEGKAYELNVTFSAGDAQPSSKTWRKVYSYSDYFNWTDVELGLKNNGTNIIGNHVDLVNNTETPMPATDLKMSIVFKEKMRTEYDSDGNVANSPWADFASVGYPCYQFVLPGGAKPRFFNGVAAINIRIIGSRT